MEHRPLGNTGLQVSALSLGTAELGEEPYGIYRPGEALRPPDGKAVALLLRAFERGINLVDTAPGYGHSEEILGRALGEWGDGQVHVATKIATTIPAYRSARAHVHASIQKSLGRLRRDHIDLLQLHNATADDLEDSALIKALVEARDQGTVSHLGASVYAVEDALAAARHPEIEVVQLAFNILDQRTAQVFHVAEGAGTAVLIRSALLKGALTDRRSELPDELSRLVQAADRAERWARRNGDDLVRGALRFCLSQREVSSILIGVRTEEELDAAVAATELEPLDRHRLTDGGRLAIDDVELIDPRRWGIP